MEVFEIMKANNEGWWKAIERNLGELNLNYESFLELAKDGAKLKKRLNPEQTTKRNKKRGKKGKSDYVENNDSILPNSNAHLNLPKTETYLMTSGWVNNSNNSSTTNRTNGESWKKADDGHCTQPEMTGMESR